MADITDPHDQTSPNELDEPHTVGNGNPASGESRGTKRARPSAPDDDDDDDEKGGRERRKIEIKFISDKSRRHITFSKRKAGIMKKVRAASPQLPPPAACTGRRLLPRVAARGTGRAPWFTCLTRAPIANLKPVAPGL